MRRLLDARRAFLAGRVSVALGIYEDLHSASPLDPIMRGDIEKILFLLARVVAREPRLGSQGARLQSRLARMLDPGSRAGGRGSAQ